MERGHAALPRVRGAQERVSVCVCAHVLCACIYVCIYVHACLCTCLRVWVSVPLWSRSVALQPGGIRRMGVPVQRTHRNTDRQTHTHLLGIERQWMPAWSEG